MERMQEEVSVRKAQGQGRGSLFFFLLDNEGAYLKGRKSLKRQTVLDETSFKSHDIFLISQLKSIMSVVQHAHLP